MARKVFISILGTNFYEKCKYTFNNTSSTETRFAQQAVLELIQANNWDKNSKCFIFTTKKAYEYNWDISERIKYPEEMEYKYTGLKSVLNNMQLPFKTEHIHIQDGKDENEIWEIFDTIFNLLEENDELYVDLTHSFRYLPMLLLVLTNYAKFLRNIKIKHISYGNFESRNKDTNEAPIIDLLPIASLQDWTFAAADYLENGNASRLKMLSAEKINPILRETKGEDQAASFIKELINALIDVTEDFQTCRGMNIIEATNLSKLKQHLNQFDKSIINPLEPLMNKIKEAFSDFDNKENIINGIQAASWCYNNGLYQQSATIMQESVVTAFCLRHNLSIDDESIREGINGLLSLINAKITNEKTKEDLESLKKKDYIQLILKDELLNDKELTGSYNSLRSLRNDINHSGMRSKQPPLSSTRIKNRLKSELEFLSNKLIK